MSIAHHVRRASSRLLGVPSKVSNDRHARRVFMSFAKKRQLVYFANIDHSQSDSHLVRGVTLGISTGDTHHVFGAHDSYDVVAIQRHSDKGHGHVWIVMEFDLHTAVNLPHVILGKKSAAQPLFESLLGIHRDMQVHEYAQPDRHARKFLKHFITYAPAAHAPLVDYIIAPELTSALIERIENIVIEIEGDSVYLCVDNPPLSVHYLDKMMHYGILFAKHIDEKMGTS